MLLLWLRGLRGPVLSRQIGKRRKDRWLLNDSRRAPGSRWADAIHAIQEDTLQLRTDSGCTVLTRVQSFRKFAVEEQQL